MESTQGTFNAGTCYRCGKGIKKDVNKAFVYYQESAKLGHVKGIPHIDMCYLDGIGVEKDDYKALTYKNLSMMEILRVHFILAGNINGINSLALCYRNGIGVARNLKKSEYWYRIEKNFISGNSGFTDVYLAFWIDIHQNSVSGDCVSFWSLQERDLYGKI
ncbi:hypothetical protein C2G38_2305648 [Gigaspora rosea]|uniref:Uncharacterized protein n=1 Tax=Gigaspora rosea TaxID=44941 RepID=A0A397VJ46_9GLOM|nr:hypothetical protein C2G38_2305648 [Gigaspora rosea]